MKKSLLLFLLLVSLLLAGCLPQVQATSTKTPTESSPVKPAATTMGTVPAASVFLPDSGCTVVSQKPTPGPTPEPTFPVVTASDWVKGPATAKVTIIEYSDFQ